MRALVTGGSRGIGKACVRALRDAGYEVCINYLHSKEPADALARETGGTALRADVADPAAVEAMFREAGPVDVLVCCAGIAYQGLITDTDPDTWNRIWQVNVSGIYNCCRAALPSMLHNHAGCIVTVSSVWGQTGASCEVAYSASKAAVIGFTKALAKEVGHSGIRVNCVAPGIIDTDMNACHSAETMAGLADNTPLGRIGTPEEVASVVRFLVSDEARFLTGQVLSPNGGFWI